MQIYIDVNYGNFEIITSFQWFGILIAITIYSPFEDVLVILSIWMKNVQAY
jgi:hypothetical protein